MNKTTREIAQFVNGELVGDAELLITGINSIEEAKEGELAFADNPKHVQLIEKSGASCVITPRNIENSSKTIIRTEKPALAFGKVLSYVHEKTALRPQGIHPTAIVEKDVKLGKDVSIGAYSVVSSGCQIGDGTILFPGVIIRQNVSIGKNVIIHSSTVVGTDGFGYHQVEGRHVKIPQIGKVVIEDNVEIGSCVVIDRATLGKTVIGRGTKIDNLVQIAHNVKIGENCIVISQTGISGSSELGNNVVLSGQVGLTDHVSLGDRTVVGAKSGVSKSFPAGTILFGIPARPHLEIRKIVGAWGRLPNLMKRVAKLEKKIAELENSHLRGGERMCSNNTS